MALPMADLNKQMKTVKVQVKLKGLKTFTLRMRLAVLIIRFGVWISGMGFEFQGLEDAKEVGANQSDT